MLDDLGVVARLEVATGKVEAAALADGGGGGGGVPLQLLLGEKVLVSCLLVLASIVEVVPFLLDDIGTSNLVVGRGSSSLVALLHLASNLLGAHVLDVGRGHLRAELLWGDATHHVLRSRHLGLHRSGAHLRHLILDGLHLLGSHLGHLLLRELHHLGVEHVCLCRARLKRVESKPRERERVLGACCLFSAGRKPSGPHCRGQPRPLCP
mmetsp:Transcript_19971/g.49937  ORF Transcript_19971/g.49937 Transcript_19971/m.49937 type:complete len:209 (-) Transcript_19971:83-709(-)